MIIDVDHLPVGIILLDERFDIFFDVIFIVVRADDNAQLNMGKGPNRT
jgi:hypothetical protein